MQWFLVSSQSYATIASNYRTFSSSPKPINMCAYALSCFSHAQLFVTLWTVALWAPLSMRFSRQEYWSGLTCHPPGNLPKPGIKPVSTAILALQVDSLPLSHWGSPYPLTATLNFLHLLPSQLTLLPIGKNLLSVSMDLPILDLLYKLDHIIYNPLHLSSFT